MANEKIEDVIKKVILGEGFLAENAEEQDTPEGEDTSDEDAIAEEEVYEDGEEIVEEEELEEAKDEESEEEEEEDEEEEEEEEDEEDSKGKKKMPAFLKGKFGKKKEKVEEAASDYASTKIAHDVNKKGAKIAEPTGDASGKNKGSIKAKPSAAKAETKYPEIKPTVKEDIAVLLNGQELSEDFKASAATLFEAHLNERVHQIEEELKGQYESLLEQHTVAVTEELVERIDDYLNYVVEEWMQENRLAVEQGLRTEITENFISNLRGLCS